MTIGATFHLGGEALLAVTDQRDMFATKSKCGQLRPFVIMKLPVSRQIGRCGEAKNDNGRALGYR
jgi:hypothetical protein